MERQGRHVRKFLGSRLRTLRQARGWSQESLGERSGLSGKFIGEVERGEKSISVDSLYRVSVALRTPLRELCDVPAGSLEAGVTDYDQILALLARRQGSDELRRAHEALKAALGET
ncbi:MAG: helix-turn-helix domain-containing protein [Candidatus Rokubacteria bacterium]|nr:helix-turn-helix domain-containing protein [Candidatus Rokubacteria bacterium]